MAEILYIQSDSQKPVAYRISGLARVLDCSQHAARRMVERGVIPSRRLGRRIIVLAAELETYLMSLPRPGVDMQDLIELHPKEGGPDESK